MNKMFVAMLCGMGLAVSSWAADKSAFMGVGAIPLNPAVAIHVGLPEGVGLSVISVAPEGPSQGRIEVKDILHKLDDQILISPEQLTILVRSHKPGDEVKVALIRRGEHKTVTVKLGETSLPEYRRVARPWPGRPTPVNPGVPPQIQEQMQQLQDMMQQFGLGPEEMEDMRAPETAPEADPAPAPHPEAQPSRPRAAKPLKALPAEEMNRPNLRVQQSFSATSTQVENGVAVTIQTQDDKRTVKIEKDGKILHEGALNTDEDLQAVPGEFRERVQGMRDSIRVQFHQPQSPRVPRIQGPVI